MQDINQNLTTQSPSTEVGIGYLLKITKMKIKENGVQYFFQPLGKTAIISCLKNINEKDLIFSLSCIQPSQQSILLPTNLMAPQVYQSRLKNDESKIKEIYNIEENFAEVIQILN